jgi:hypothetical protein
MITGCREQAQNPDQNNSNSPIPVDTVTVIDTLNSEVRLNIEREVVLERVKSIYSMIRSDYLSRGGVFESELYDKVFCSKSWNKLLMAVRCKEDRTGTLFFEINPWSMTRYSGNIISYDEFEVTSLVIGPEMTASVTFTVYEDDTYTPARIDLIYEDGRWVIDNFYNLRYMLNVRSSMWNYLDSDIIMM